MGWENGNYKCWKDLSFLFVVVVVKEGQVADPPQLSSSIWHIGYYYRAVCEIRNSATTL